MCVCDWGRNKNRVLPKCIRKEPIHLSGNMLNGTPGPQRLNAAPDTD